MESEICTKVLRNLSGKIRTKFSATTNGYSKVKITQLDDIFSEIFEREASPVEGKSLQQKNSNEKPKDLHMPEQKCRKT